MRISIIVAMTRERVIGRGGGMPWHLPADLKRFKSLTMGKPIIMGRKTFESLGRILPGRRHIVISRKQNYKASGAEIVDSLDAALTAAADVEEAFVIGGAEVFREGLTRADRTYVTLINADIEGDIYFPNIDWDDWHEIERSEGASDDTNAYSHTFRVLERRSHRLPGS